MIVRRLRRGTAYAFAALSLAAGVLALAWWPASYERTADVQASLTVAGLRASAGVDVWSSCGELMVSAGLTTNQPANAGRQSGIVTRSETGPRDQNERWLALLMSFIRDNGWQWRGFACAARRDDWSGDRNRSVVVALPHWAAASVCFVAAGLTAWRLWRGGRRRTAGLCAACGYDLRASPDRCPECGSAVQLVDSSANRSRTSAPSTG